MYHNKRIIPLKELIDTNKFAPEGALVSHENSIYIVVKHKGELGLDNIDIIIGEGFYDVCAFCDMRGKNCSHKIRDGFVFKKVGKVKSGL